MQCLSDIVMTNSCCCKADILFLKRDCRVHRQSSNPVCGFSMMEQVRLCAVWSTENWHGSSMNHILGWILRILLSCFRKRMSVLKLIRLCGYGWGHSTKLQQCTVFFLQEQKLILLYQKSQTLQLIVTVLPKVYKGHSLVGKPHFWAHDFGIPSNFRE